MHHTTVLSEYLHSLFSLSYFIFLLIAAIVQVYFSKSVFKEESEGYLEKKTIEKIEYSLVWGELSDYKSKENLTMMLFVFGMFMIVSISVFFFNRDGVSAASFTLMGLLFLEYVFIRRTLLYVYKKKAIIFLELLKERFSN